MHPFYGPSSLLLAEESFWWAGLLSMAMYLIFWAVVIVLGVRFAKKYFIDPRRPEEDSAINILRERYARGEVGEAEFQQKLELLEKTRNRNSDEKMEWKADQKIK